MISILRTGCASAALIAATLTVAAQTSAPPPGAAPSSPPATTIPAAPPPSTQPASPPAPAAQGQAETNRNMPTDNQIADEVDARIAQLKANLRLSAEEDGKWGPLRDALRSYGVAAMKSRYAYENLADRRRPRDRDQRDDSMATPQDKRPDDLAIMRLQADAMASRASSLKTIADAAEPLYASLGERQKRTLMRFIEREFSRRGR